MFCALSLRGLCAFGAVHAEVGGRKTREPGRQSRGKETERETRRGRKERRNIMLAESGGDLKRKVAKTEKRERGKGRRKRKTGEIFVWPDATVPIVLGSRLCECIFPFWGVNQWAFPSAGQPTMTNTVCCLCLGVVCANTFHHFLEKISGCSLQQDSPQ